MMKYQIIGKTWMDKVENISKIKLRSVFCYKNIKSILQFSDWWGFGGFFVDKIRSKM